MGLGTGLGAGAATGLGAGAGLAAAGLTAAALGAALRAFGFALALAFLAAAGLRALFLAAARFFLRAGAVFFVFFVVFAFFDFFFAFFAMIVLPIVSAQVSIRLSIRLKRPGRADLRPQAEALPPLRTRQTPPRGLRRAAGFLAVTHDPSSYFYQATVQSKPLFKPSRCSPAPQACDLPSPNRSARPYGPPGSPCRPRSG
jgi:hypothetical protein